MSGFDGGNFKKLPMQNDNNLTTNTNNFEFKYLPRELIEKAIQKVRNEEDLKIKEKLNVWHKYCSDTPAIDEVIGKKDQTMEGNTVIPDSARSNANEVKHLIREEKQKDESTSLKKASSGYFSPYEDPQLPQHKEVQRYTTILRDKSQSNEQKHTEEKSADTKNSNEIMSLTSICRNEPMIPDYFEYTPIAQIVEEHKIQLPKWVEIIEPSKETRLDIDARDDSMNTSMSTQSTYFHRYDCYKNSSSLYPYHQMSAEQNQPVAHCMPTMLMTEVINDHIRIPDDCRTIRHTNVNGCLESYIIEDSDLECEIMNQQRYTSNTQPSPKPTEVLNLSIDDKNYQTAEFVEHKGRIQQEDGHFLRNSSLIKFTDEQRQKLSNKQHCQSEQVPLTTAKQEQFKPITKSNLSQKQFKRTFERLAGGGPTRPPEPHRHIVCNSIPDATSTQSSTRHNRILRNWKQEPSQSARTGYNCFSTDKESITNRMSTESKNTVRSKNLIKSKSIEDLKFEKTNIFRKMTATQEKMIDVLDTLRITLLEYNAPANSSEKSKRQKNAFEFSVRFSRNFLYPLKGMKEYLQLTSAEQFNNISSNDACSRVGYMYGLLLQSLIIYQKQLRFFLLDHLHQELTDLVEIIECTTEICLEKDIFSKQDVIVDCLKQKSSIFLNFLKDLPEQRIQSARKSHRKITLYNANSNNDLNMYEPQLAPGLNLTDRSAKTRKHKVKGKLNQVRVDESPDILLEKPQDDEISTHIQDVVDTKSSDCLVYSQFNIASGDVVPPLDKNTIDALKNLTKEQVRTVLELLLDSLYYTLGDQNNSEVTEAIVNAFNIEVDKQKNIDNKFVKERTNKAMELSSVDGGRNTCKPSKAAKQTKTLRQQNSHETLNTVRSSTTSTTAGNIVDDDNNSNSNNNHSNNKAKSKRNSTTHLRTAAANVVVGGGGVGTGDWCGSRVVGERSREANHMEETQSSVATTKLKTESVSRKINKSKNLMNEDQISEELRQRTDLQSDEDERKEEHPEYDITSDGEFDDDAKLKKPNSVRTSFSKSRYFQKPHDSYQSTQRSTCSHMTSNSSSSCEMSSPSPAWQTVKKKSRSTGRKRNPFQTLPIVPSVKLSSSGNVIYNIENDKSQLDQTPKTKIKHLRKMVERDSSAERVDLGKKISSEQKTIANRNTNFKLATANIKPLSLGVNKTDITPNVNISPYSNSEDSLSIKSGQKKMKNRQSTNLTKLVPPKKNLQQISNSDDEHVLMEQMKNMDKTKKQKEKEESKTKVNLRSLFLRTFTELANGTLNIINCTLNGQHSEKQSEAPVAPGNM